jgi:hypothetical protein
MAPGGFIRTVKQKYLSNLLSEYSAPRIANCQLPTTNYPLPTANYQLPTTNCLLPTTYYQLPTANGKSPKVNFFQVYK